MLPQTFEFIDGFAALAKRVDWVYDFALPPLVLHALSFKTAKYLEEWIGLRPTNALTVLDTHDGIGIIDIGADAADRNARPGLVPAVELDQLMAIIHTNNRDQSREATGAAASNLDLYQINCTFVDAVGRDERSYLIARAIQFFLPGVPKVYYVGLLAGPAFGGCFTLEADDDEQRLAMRWDLGNHTARLWVDFATLSHEIHLSA